MGLTGRYDFKGIKRYGAMGLRGLIAATGWGAAIFKIPVIGALFNGAIELAVNWLANNGLMVLNIGAISVDGEIDQKQFDDHMNEAFDKIKNADGKLTKDEVKQIDDEVIKYFRRFGRITKPD